MIKLCVKKGKRHNISSISSNNHCINYFGRNKYKLSTRRKRNNNKSKRRKSKNIRRTNKRKDTTCLSFSVNWCQGNYTKESLETELEKEFGEDFEEVDDSNETNWKLKAQGQEITIPAGKKETNPSGKLSEEQLRMKITNETGDCMIDEKGNIIPIDAWVYDKYDENMTAILHGTSYYDDWDSEWVFQTNAYKKKYC